MFDRILCLQMHLIATLKSNLCKNTFDLKGGHSSSTVRLTLAVLPPSTPKASIDKKSKTMSAAAIADISAGRQVSVDAKEIPTDVPFVS